MQDVRWRHWAITFLDKSINDTPEQLRVKLGTELNELKEWRKWALNHVSGDQPHMHHHWLQKPWSWIRDFMTKNYEHHGRSRDKLAQAKADLLGMKHKLQIADAVFRKADTRAWNAEQSLEMWKKGSDELVAQRVEYELKKLEQEPSARKGLYV